MSWLCRAIMKKTLSKNRCISHKVNLVPIIILLRLYLTFRIKKFTKLEAITLNFELCFSNLLVTKTDLMSKNWMRFMSLILLSISMETALHSTILYWSPKGICVTALGMIMHQCSFSFLVCTPYPKPEIVSQCSKVQCDNVIAWLLNLIKRMSVCFMSFYLFIFPVIQFYFYFVKVLLQIK